MSVDQLMNAAPADHVVHFYASDDELVERAASHLADAVESGAVAIVIATPPHARAFESWIAAAGIDVAAAVADGAYVVLDAEETLQRFLVDGRPDVRRFDEVVGELVRSAAATGRRVCAYGEMVALLWDAGRVNAAIELESLWNELSTRVPFSLLCSYPSLAVSGEDQTELLAELCCMHTAVVGSDPRGTSMRRFEASPAAPRASRRFVVETLQDLGCEHSVVDAALVITELATNAVQHAKSDFTVSIIPSCEGIRLEVFDGSPLAPTIRQPSLTAPSGRGLYLISTLASAWGTIHTGGGKVVWAHIRPAPGTADSASARDP